ncbi:MAG: DUF1800 domain-containing protein [Chloroflexi bacterium]|nr:DUF1800 domain-containing protein [Chloroflexota bacterium]
MTTLSESRGEVATGVALYAHLLRRAGFSASRAQVEEYAKRPYEEVVEELLNPQDQPEIDEDRLLRYYPHYGSIDNYNGAGAGRWYYRMINSERQLQEKIALFWHHVFATAWHKTEHSPTVIRQIEMFRQNGLGKFSDILLDLSRDPAMIHWLDNNQNHSYRINENFGRELMELFSMGIGAYSEHDIKEAARAFTGWTFRQPMPLYPYGHWDASYEYDPNDHDDGEKTFLGQTGNFNGQDVIDIIVDQESAARFISRHLYNFFVADESQVPAWSIEPPQDPEAIDIMVNAYFESGAEIRSVLRAMFNSDFFKRAAYKRVKSPVEFVTGVIKLSGEYTEPDPGLADLVSASTAMGQELLNPATVEGWHTGKEWIDGGTLNERVNFAVEHLQKVDAPGVLAIVDRLAALGRSLSPEEFLDECLDLVGPLPVSDETRGSLLEFANTLGDVNYASDRDESLANVTHMLRLIVAAPEYQFG